MANKVAQFQNSTGKSVDAADSAAQKMRDEGNVVEMTDTKQASAQKSSLRKLILPVVVVAALAGGAYFGYDYWTTGRFMVSTDDAYIGGDLANLAPKVTGYVKKVNVSANQKVKAGDVLVTLDDGDYKIALEQAQAKLATQNFALKSIAAQISVAKAGLGEAKAKKAAAVASLDGATLKKERASTLQSQAFASTSSLDDARIAFEEAQAGVMAADAAIQSAQATIASLGAQYTQAQSVLKSEELAVQKAKRDLSFTVIKAPFDGVVGNLSVQEGDLVTPGLRLAALVPTNALYIDANFKETQIAEIKPGAVVDIYVDAFDDDVLHGKVESISPASGSVFSLLPAENATGNFTKITQRIPVRIALPQKALDSGRLAAGMSVVVDVDSRTGKPEASLSGTH